MLDTVVMFSGGVDSLMAWYYLDKPTCINVDLGSPYGVKERDHIDNMSKNLGVDVIYSSITTSRPFGFLQDNFAAFFPSRNLFLAILGSWYSDNVCIAGIKGDLVEDKNPTEFDRMSEILSDYSRRRIKVFSPFWDMTKTDIVRWFLSQGGDPDILRMSVSCYHPTEHQCGECKCCFRKWVALKGAGVDPGYNISDDIKKMYKQRALSGYYDADRCRDILEVL